MDRRLELQSILENLLGSRNVYFQPPTSIKMQYPAIRYALSGMFSRRANNGVYGQHNVYSVTVIDPDPENECIGKLSQLPMCSYDRHYVVDNLNHDVFTLYF